MFTAALAGGSVAAVLAATLASAQTRAPASAQTRAPASARARTPCPAQARGRATARTLAPCPARRRTPGVATITPADGGTPVADLAYTARNGSVYVDDVFSPGSRATALGGRLAGGPADIFQPNSERLDVFGRGTDGALWWRQQTAHGWTPWRSLGGRLTSKPAVAENTSGHISVFVRGTDGAIWYRTLAGGHWGGWTRLGGDLLAGTAPAAAYGYYGFNEHLLVAAVGTDRAVWLFSGIPGKGFGVSYLGGATFRDPAITFVSGTARAPNTPLAVVYVAGTNHALWAKQVTLPVTSARGAWRSLGGRLTSGVAASGASGGAFSYVFALGTDDQFWMRVGNWPSLNPWQRV